MSLKFGEAIESQILTGQIVGYRALYSYNRVAFVGMKNIMCTAILSSMESSYISSTGGECRYFVIEDNIYSLVEEIGDYKPNLVVVCIGGSEEFEKLKELLPSFFSALTEAEIDTDFLFHQYVYEKVRLDVLQGDPGIRNYLADKRLMTYTYNFEEGLIELNDIYILEKEIYFETVEEYPISFKHAKLLIKESEIKNKKVGGE